jgi:hypothetical protein
MEWFMRKGNIAILILFILCLYCYDIILILTLPDLMNMFAVIWFEGFELISESIFEFFFKPKFFSNFSSGMPLLIWSIFFMIIVMFYIIKKCFIRDRIKIFITMKILNIALIPFWIVNYFFIFHDGLSGAFGYVLFFNLGGFITIIFLISINYIFQIFISLPSILYINFLYKNHSMKIINRVLHTILQFVLLLGLFDSIYLIIKYKRHNGKANVA